MQILKPRLAGAAEARSEAVLTPDCLNAASVLLRTPGHTGPENPFTPPVSAVPTGVVQCTAPVATGDDPEYP